VLAVAATALLAGVVLLAASATALAQPYPKYVDSTGYWRYYYGSWYHYRTGSSYSDRVLPHGVSPAHYGAYLAPSRPTGPGYSYPWPVPLSPRPQPESAPTALPVHIDVRVPADAAIWFDGARTKQGGTFRRFVSPPLPVGRSYTYEVRVRWTEETPVTQTRRVTVRAGEWVSLTFPDASRGAAAPGKGGQR
jgi:uncharacterized protein (TIGR03000 family)